MSKKTARWLRIFVVLPAIIVSACATTQQVASLQQDVDRIEEKIDRLLGEGERITEAEATAVATRFADLQRVDSVAARRVASTNTSTFDVRGSDAKGDLLIGIDAATGEVKKYVSQCPYPGRDSEAANLTADEAVAASLRFLADKELPTLPQGFVRQQPRLLTSWEMKHWKVEYLHYAGDVQVTSDFVLFIVNAENGQVASYSKVFHPVTVSTDPRLGREAAMARAREILGQDSLTAYANLQPASATLKILYPNYFFDDFVYRWGSEQKLAWVVGFFDAGEPAIDVWVDAQDGAGLGGEIYERPVPELWGIPDQEGDVTNIWEPALDAMQYDTSHTFLGDSTDTAVVTSIEDGDYWIFHTHGATGLARVGHSGSGDSDYLTPDEIPANDLRYALLSTCKSGVSTADDDFREVFIDQGSDVFQGYEESINPDPYERALTRYLALGDSLWNAHWNAVADVDPWFTVVIEYGPPLFCFNQLRLAPLQVSVAAPSSGWFGATIQAQVRNREDARATTATNVTAELVMPPGFLAIGGATRSTAALPHNDTWTTQWTVQAPFLIPLGTKTFDVVVRSDNLGVAVDDFDQATAADPLYHPVEISFGFPWWVLEIPDYLEVWDWWKIAAGRFPGFPEPGRILDLRQVFDRYRTPDDLKRDPAAFLDAVASLAELERAFGDRAMAQGTAPPQLVERFLAAVNRKASYVGQLRQQGIGDATEAITQLGLLQKESNAAAFAAFSG